MSRGAGWRLGLGWLIGLGALPGLASPPLQFNLQGTAQVAFTPGDAADQMVIGAIQGARRQILVQAYGFTHQGIAAALVAARQQGVEVQLIADAEQAETLATSRILELARQGVMVWLDKEHAAAHNKVMLIDAEGPEAVLITGSYNFTHAAQYRNAENLLLIRGNPGLVAAYIANWRRHRIHSYPLRAKP